MTFYKNEQVEVEYEGGNFIITELDDGFRNFTSNPLRKDEVNMYLEDIGQGPINLEKPQCELIGQDGNIFNLMAITSRVLKGCGMKEKADEMIQRITKTSKSYDESLRILMDYVEII